MVPPGPKRSLTSTSVALWVTHVERGLSPTLLWGAHVETWSFRSGPRLALIYVSDTSESMPPSDFGVSLLEFKRLGSPARLKEARDQTKANLLGVLEVVRAVKQQLLFAEDSHPRAGKSEERERRRLKDRRASGEDEDHRKLR